jgi:hypothetical protein
MHLTLTDPPTTIEPIDHAAIQPDIADWLPWRFAGTLDPSTWPAEPINLPIIEW